MENEGAEHSAHVAGVELKDPHPEWSTEENLHLDMNPWLYFQPQASDVARRRLDGTCVCRDIRAFEPPAFLCPSADLPISL